MLLAMRSDHSVEKGPAMSKSSRRLWILRSAAVTFISVIVVGLQTMSIARQSLSGGNLRVSTHDLVPSDQFSANASPRDVLQQNEPSIAVHPTNPNLVAVGMNDVRALALS